MNKQHKWMLDNITALTDDYKERLEWVFEDGIPAWERFNVQRVVSMAANIVGGYLIVGNRHFCPIMRMTIDNLGLLNEDDCGKAHQGFVDQYGVYMNRQDAWDVAKSAGQIKQVYTEGTLFSECYL